MSDRFAPRLVNILLIAICLYVLTSIGYKNGFSPAILFASFSPNVAIQESIPTVTLEIYKLVRKYSLSDFSLSASLSADPLVFQRTIEFSYPIRVLRSADFVVAKPEDGEYGLCNKLEEGENVVLYKCDD